MRKLTGLLAAVVITLGAAASSSAATLTLQDAVLGVTIGALPPVTVGQSPANILVSVDDSSGGFALTGGIFETSIVIPKALFTGVPLISSLNVTLTNAGGAFGMGSGLNGGFGGISTIAGAAVVGVLGGLINLSVPLSNAGVGGTTVVGAAALMITITGHIWTTASAAISGVTSPTEGGFTNTAAITGFDNRTESFRGAIQLVTPLRVDTGATAGVLATYGILTLNFTPEPGAALALGSAVLGLVAVGRMRSRKR
jgi:hypothetical protein